MENKYPLITQQNGAFFVTSEGGKVLGKFGTIEGAKNFKRNYSASKGFSSTVQDAGMEEAMRVFKEIIKGNN